MKGFWYLATPYSKYAEGIEAAYWMAVRARGYFLQAGLSVFSPIVHSHPVAVECNLDPLDHNLWLPDDEPLMEAARGLIMYQADGWERSYGMQVEADHFIARGKPLVNFKPGVHTVRSFDWEHL
jgi:hypothetical protein